VSHAAVKAVVAHVSAELVTSQGQRWHDPGQTGSDPDLASGDLTLTDGQWEFVLKRAGSVRGRAFDAPDEQNNKAPCSVSV
jgi:hypothetical protein